MSLMIVAPENVIVSLSMGAQRKETSPIDHESGRFQCSTIRPYMRRLLLLLALLAVADAPRPSRVEVLTPKPPTPVVAEGKRVLGYELQITNFDPKPLTLRRIEVFDSTNPIADYSGKALEEMIVPVGSVESAPAATSSRATEGGFTIDSGRRAIVFVWLTQSPSAPLPHALRHRLTFEESSIDDLIVPVANAHVPVLRPPFAGGEWLAGNGPSNTSVHRRSVTALNGRTYVGQRFAIDWLLIGKNGDTTHDGREHNENYWGFGYDVRAMASGEVTEVVDEYEDHPPGKLPPVTLENIGGNHVIIRIAPQQYVLYAHLQQHSIRVYLHQKVSAGDVIAKLGNSGNATGPHLHIEVVDGNAMLGAEGIPFLFDHFRFLGYGHEFEESHHPDEPRANTMPVDDEVIAPDRR
jgi:hypothetical protein